MCYVISAGTIPLFGGSTCGGHAVNIMVVGGGSTVCMNLKAHPTEIALALLSRSICSVQVAAVLVDDWGVFSWGWNSMGPDGLGQHAEEHAISRANRKRLEGATIYIASQRKRNKRPVCSRPCETCQPILKGIGVVFRDGDGNWKPL